MRRRTLGFAVLHARTPWDDEATRAAALTLLTASSWEGGLRYFMSVAMPGQPLSRPPGMIPAKRLREEIGRALANPDIASVSLQTARESRDDSRDVSWERLPLTGGDLVLTHGARPADGGAADEWVADVLTYCDDAGGSAGVATMMADPLEAGTECWHGSFSRKDGIAHPWPEQAARMKGVNAPYMGTRYMRFPRWGTLVSHDHVAQLGGVEAISRAIEPAVMRSLSGGVYFQLTGSVTTAMGDEAMAKQRAFIELAAPLLPPPVMPPG